SPANFAITEDQVSVGTVKAADAEQDAFSFALAGGSGSAFFFIDPHTGALRFINSPDFETPGDANPGNTYPFVRSATDVQPMSSTQTIHVKVTDLLEVGQTINGGNSNDAITGTPGNDTIDAGNGNDNVNGGDGNDKLLGGNGNDVLIGGRGADVLDGGNDND